MCSFVTENEVAESQSDLSVRIHSQALPPRHAGPQAVQKMLTGDDQTA